MRHGVAPSRRPRVPRPIEGRRLSPALARRRRRGRAAAVAQGRETAPVPTLPVPPLHRSLRARPLMRYLVLSSDYDGTLALHGTVATATIAALERFRASGRKLVMVTGRELDDLRRVFPRYDLFD